ncbi:MAG TPA: ribonuclease III domain-containing protein [Mesotoga infera]|jgi:ribonuclease-3 family protein|uniref:Mini-ribonuclease 3 n=1 Tax=Mesotoga infera TaxID=1236046 RepID=A0A7Z7LGH2_9BACT|nr:ribonuclease III domain-containing protein [Mesotoga infera]HRV02552.1 ribonuclease III domain-containing protein [Mesotoga sp.]SSC13453.1 Mini-ribonuclease 3 [Mesotoga infera]HNS66186.1 ribonuclease III domain-containing protein [Mesotoga infera]HON27042.1 ribonuclease III domain-containing protein [Mesotoga infera]HPD37042.1 ribonuclease III domain-containing protein [Mesotoga infera]
MSENSRELSTESMNISDERSGEKLPDVLFQTFADPERLSLDSLSYVGDAVYTLFFRLSTLSRAHRRAGVQHDIVSEYVSARGQHRALEILMPLLTKEEKSLVRRGYNSRGAKKHGDDEDYRMATALEALVGYLYLKGELGHLRELLERVV